MYKMSGTVRCSSCHGCWQISVQFWWVIIFPCSCLTTTSIFPSSIATVLTLSPHPVVSRLQGYYAEVKGAQLQTPFPILFLLFFFLFPFATDGRKIKKHIRPQTKKKGMALIASARLLAIYNRTDSK